MITGDHELTAKAIAKLGIITSGKDVILSGTKWQLSEKSFRYSGTCARFNPEQKLKYKSYCKQKTSL
jgi:magnesium-transporting ATPase (P-type)